MSEFRIKSAEGRWASMEPEQRPWISGDMVDLWRAAVEKSTAADSPELFAALDMAEQLGFCDTAVEVVMPMGPKELEKARVGEEIKKKEFLSADRQRHWGRPATEQDWMQNREWQMRHVNYEAAIKRQVRFLVAPSVTWATVPGDARMVDPNKARVAIQKAGLALRLRKILPKARAQCRKLGGVEGEWMEPKFDKPGIGTIELAAASCQEFRADEEFEDKKAIAIYVDQGGRKGFLDKRGAAKNDLAEACLFPNAAKAATFARRFVGNCYAVEVLVSAVGYKPLLGRVGAATDLDAVIAARERKEIMQVLEKAQIEQLEEELARRRLEAGAPAPAEPAARKTRL